MQGRSQVQYPNSLNQQWFFIALPNCPTKMCLVMTRHILVLPRHKFWVLIYKLWTCNAHMPPSVPLYGFYVCIAYPKHALQDSNYVSGHHPRADKKKKKQKILSAIWTHC